MTAEWVEAEGDEDALEQSRVRCKIGGYELWERSRLVARTNGAPDPD